MVHCQGGARIDSKTETHTFATLAYKMLKEIEAREEK
jgi:hypothetical protein